MGTGTQIFCPMRGKSPVSVMIKALLKIRQKMSNRKKGHSFAHCNIIKHSILYYKFPGNARKFLKNFELNFELNKEKWA
jgi:hypothetical protein